MRRCEAVYAWLVGEGALPVGAETMDQCSEVAEVAGGRLWRRCEFVGEKGEMDRRVLEEVLGGRAAQEAQQVGQKSLVKRNFAV